MDWIPTACNLCYANCGVLVRLDESHRIIEKVKGDRAHPMSKGYTCNKAAQINYYQNGRDRLTSPLRRRPDGTFEAIDWETAIAEVAGGLTRIRDTYGGDKLFYYGGGSQGNHLGGSYASSMGPALEATYSSNALAQEKSGLAWMNGRMLGGSWHGDFDECDVAIIIGKNPWQSNGMQRARIRMRDLGRDPERTLIVLDPKRTETAELADIHLAVRPGRDVWCISAILGRLVQTGRHNVGWLADHATGTERILEQLATVPVSEYAAFAGISMEQIEAVVTAIAGTTRIAVAEDLGVEMGPNSTLCTYLNMLLFLLTGSFAASGGTHLITGITGGYMADGEQNPEVNGYETDWQKTPVTAARMVQGMMPCNSIPEEILTDHPDRFRAAIVESANPVHSLADTEQFRAAFDALEFVVVIDVALTETAQLADYVLPASSTYEKCEGTFYPQEFPRNFFHLRPRLIEPLPGTLPEGEIYARLIEAMALFEPGELEPLRAAAERGLHDFAKAMTMVWEQAKVQAHLPYVLYRTLGEVLPVDRKEAASLWPHCLGLATRLPDHVRAAGYEGSDGVALGIALFEGILAGESGVIILEGEVGDGTQWRRPDGKVNLLVGEMSDELDRLCEYAMPERPDAFPLLLCAGERGSWTANTIIRDPAWRKSNNPTSLLISPLDGESLGLADAGVARLVTKRKEVLVTVEFDRRMPEGLVSLPNGLGTEYPTAEGTNERAGVHLNELTDLADRDPHVGTPWHKHVRARLEPLC